MGGFADSEAVSEISTANRTHITLRGKDFCGEVIGRMSLTGFFYFHVTGREPSAAQVAMLDALLVSITEHGLSPAALAARFTYASGPEALQGAVAAGVLGAGSVVLGSAGEAGELLARGAERVRAGERLSTVADELVAETLAAGGKLPGFGHPLHKPDDPRSTRLLEIARDLGVAGEHVALLEAVAAAADRVYGKHLVLNIQGAIAAIALDMDLPAFLTRAIPIVARAVGVLGHIAEERERPLGFHVTMLANHAVTYVDPLTGRRAPVIDD